MDWVCDCFIKPIERIWAVSSPEYKNELNPRFSALARIWFKNVLLPLPGLPVKTVKVPKFSPPDVAASSGANPVSMLGEGVVSSEMSDASTNKSSTHGLSRTVALTSLASLSCLGRPFF